MALGTIKIDKILEKDKTGYYKVSSDDYEGNDFYMAIDKENRLIKFYLDSTFSKPVKIIDHSKGDESIGSISGVHMRTYSGALIKALKMLELDTFPERISYSG